MYIELSQPPLSEATMKRFYQSKRWRRKTKEIRARDNNECQHCKQQGKYSAAVCVHHIKELKDYPMFAMNDSNLITLCATCHNKIHDKFENINKKSQKYTNLERW